MTNTTQPSQPGYAFSSADIIDPTRSNGITNAMLQQIVTTQTSSGATPPDSLALLAQMLLLMRRKNCNYTAYPFSLPAQSVQQILPQNTNRKALVISFNNAAVGFLFEPSNANALDLSTQLPLLANYTSRSVIPISGLLIFDLNVAPSNPVTIVNTNAFAVTGVILEGN